MNMFEEDFALLRSKLEGYEQLSEEAQLTLRAAAFAMWVHGVQRAQRAQAEGGMLKLAETMIQETMHLMQAENKVSTPPSMGSATRSKETLQ
jgi:hypothetical protein